MRDPDPCVGFLFRCYSDPYAVSSASVHDSQKLEDLLDPGNTASTV